jgi:hypothetical protein
MIAKFGWISAQFSDHRSENCAEIQPNLRS